MTEGSSPCQHDLVLQEFASFLTSDGTVLTMDPTFQAKINRLGPMISPSVAVGQAFCSIPAFSLEKSNNSHAHGTKTKATLEHDAASSLRRVVEVPSNHLHDLPSMTAYNILRTFMSLSDSRIRSTVHAFSRHSDPDPANKLSQILQIFSSMSSHLVKPAGITNTFRVTGASSQVTEEKRIAPLDMESHINLSILGDHISAIFSCTGTVSGVFDTSEPPKLVSVSILLDTADLLKAMMATVRDAVKMATNKASELCILYSSGLDTIHPLPASNQNQPFDAHGMSHNAQYHEPMNEEKAESADENMLPPPAETQDSVSRPQQPNQRARQQQEGIHQIEKSINSRPSGVEMKFSGVDLLAIAAWQHTGTRRVLPDVRTRGAQSKTARSMASI